MSRLELSEISSDERVPPYAKEDVGPRQMKTCSRCQEEKQISEFHKDRQRKDGLYPWCKFCVNKQSSNWARKNKEKKAASCKLWKRNNRERLAFWHKGYQADNKDRIAEYDRQYRLKRKYNLTLEEYNQILSEQDGVCAICKVEGTPHLSVDHDHETGKIRGLLCKKCNLGLGYFNDSANLTQKATDYLKGEY